jgi:undecaprenyl-diphosphatase
VSELDAQLFRLVYDAWDGALTSVALWLSVMGGGWAMLAFVPLLITARWRTFMLFLTAALATSGLAVFALKHLVVRQRPCVALPGVHALCKTPTDPSFPSGHSCGSFTLAFFLVTVLWASEHDMPPARRALLSAAILGAALAVAWSRVYLGVHFPGDVTAGATLGAIVGTLGARLYVQKAPSWQVATPAELARR